MFSGKHKVHSPEAIPLGLKTSNTFEWGHATKGLNCAVSLAGLILFCWKMADSHRQQGYTTGHRGFWHQCLLPVCWEMNVTHESCSTFSCQEVLVCLLSLADSCLNRSVIVFHALPVFFGQLYSNKSLWNLCYLGSFFRYKTELLLVLWLEVTSDSLSVQFQ